MRIYEVQDRLFLESLRFDRTGEYGRLPLISLQAIDNEFSGIGSGWLSVSKELHRLGLISWQHLYDIAVYWGFGRLIYNTDMHLGNVSFLIDGSGFSLAPIYDMCSMGFAPKSTGEIPPYAFALPDINAPLAFVDKTIPMIKQMAQEFWRKVAESELVSSELKNFVDRKFSLLDHR